jgi:ABC-2 type transport system ATP-binding protein
VTLVAEDNNGAVQELRERFNLSPEIQDGHITFSIPQGEIFLPRLIKNFTSPLTSVGIHRPTLDDVFLKLTGRAIRDTEAGEKEQMREMMQWRRGR